MLSVLMQCSSKPHHCGWCSSDGFVVPFFFLLFTLCAPSILLCKVYCILYSTPQARSPLLHIHGGHVWLVDVLGGELSQLGHKAPDEAALWVVLLAKRDRAVHAVVLWGGTRAAVQMQQHIQVSKKHQE